jgi:1-acyl-sn-glycerol-3-phosphate acyltransferase
MSDDGRRGESAAEVRPDAAAPAGEVPAGRGGGIAAAGRAGRAAAEAPIGQRVRPEQVVRWGPIWGRRVGQVLDHLVWSTKVVGSGNVPRTGPVILAANHIGVIDGPVLHGASPRGSHIIVKQEMFKGFLGGVLWYSGQIPVDRRSGRAALTAALALLEEGRVVGIFPEGTRGSGRVANAQAGIAWLAVRSGAPVVPVAILGTRPSGAPVSHVPRFRSRLHVVFGRPFRAAPEGAGTGRAALAAAMETIQAALATHVAAATEVTGVDLPSDEDVVDVDAPEERGPAAPEAERAVGHEVTAARRVEAGPEAVWAVLTDLDAAPATISAITAVDVLSKGPYGVGTRWRETRRLFGRESTEEMWVTAAEPPVRTVVEAESRGAHYTTTFTLAPVGGGTQLEVTFAARTTDPRWWQRLTWALLGRLGARATRRALAQDLSDIAAAAAEARSGGAAASGPPPAD